MIRRRSTRVAPRRSALKIAEDLVNGDRRDAYGSPLLDYERVAGMVNALFARKLKEPFTAQDFPLIMICIKMSREVHRHKDDTLVDIAGYVAVLERLLEEQCIETTNK